MFTGIVEEVGTVRSLERGGGGAWLKVRAQRVLEDLKIGDSIAVEGVCLTVTELSEGDFTAELSTETLRTTSLGNIRPGRPVNLERSLRLGERLGGHLVTGHVDGVGKVVGKGREGPTELVTIEAPQEVMRYLVDKGSVAVDGISLTVARLERGAFTVAIISHTAEATTLLTKGVGEAVNLEADIMGKYVERLLKKEERSLDREFLAEHGYL